MLDQSSSTTSAAFSVSTHKMCLGCGESKPLDDFYAAKKGKDGRMSRCRSCETTRAREQTSRRREGLIPRLPSPTEKRCSRCHEIKVAAMFGKQDWKPTGLASACLSCMTSQDLERRYGLTGADHAALVSTQNGACVICHHKRRLVVDHDHETGRVRGLLCHRCNSGIGYFADNPTILTAAIAYLEGSR